MDATTELANTTSVTNNATTISTTTTTTTEETNEGYESIPMSTAKIENAENDENFKDDEKFEQDENSGEIENSKIDERDKNSENFEDDKNTEEDEKFEEDENTEEDEKFEEDKNTEEDEKFNEDENSEENKNTVEDEKFEEDENTKIDKEDENSEKFDEEKNNEKGENNENGKIAEYDENDKNCENLEEDENTEMDKKLKIDENDENFNGNKNLKEDENTEEDGNTETDENAEYDENDDNLLESRELIERPKSAASSSSYSSFDVIDVPSGSVSRASHYEKEMSSTSPDKDNVRYGKCKWFNVAKGWGFIQPNDGGPEIFVHQSVIQMTGFRSLSQQEDVEFETKETERGLEATRVSGINGADCHGSTFQPKNANGRCLSKRKRRRVRCYNCGEFSNHLAANCELGPQPKLCHFCKKGDHLLIDCPEKKVREENDEKNCEKLEELEITNESVEFEGDPQWCSIA